MPNGPLNTLTNWGTNNLPFPLPVVPPNLLDQSRALTAATAGDAWLPINIGLKSLSPVYCAGKRNLFFLDVTPHFSYFYDEQQGVTTNTDRRYWNQVTGWVSSTKPRAGATFQVYVDGKRGGVSSSFIMDFRGAPCSVYQVGIYPARLSNGLLVAKYIPMGLKYRFPGNNGQSWDSVILSEFPTQFESPSGSGYQNLTANMVLVFEAGTAASQFAARSRRDPNNFPLYYP